MGSIALVCALPGASSLTRTSTGSAAAAAAAAPFQADLRIPPALVPVRSTATEDHYAVTIQEGRAEIIPGTLTPVYGYDGSTPGRRSAPARAAPCVVRADQRARRTAQNVHLHGGHHARRDPTATRCS